MKNFFISCLLAVLLAAVFVQAQSVDEANNSRTRALAYRPGLERVPEETNLDSLAGDRYLDEVEDSFSRNPLRLPRKWNARERNLGASYLGKRGVVHETRRASTGFSYSRATPSFSAGVDTAWVRHYASGRLPSHDEATAMTVDAAGNVYVTGSSSSSLYGVDYLTIKYTPAGVEVWTVRYNGPANGDDFASAIAVDQSGNVYVTGSSESSGTGSDYATIKYNSAGVQQWVIRYDEPANSWDDAVSIAVDATGNVYVTGTSPGSASLDDYATLKYNSAGVQQWVARYDGSNNSWDQTTALAVDVAGNVYVTGSSYGIGYDYATVKYNSAGLQQWAARYNGPGNGFDTPSDLAVDGAGNVYVTGGSEGSGSDRDYATIKYNPSGAQQWAMRYNGPGNGIDDGNALVVDNTGNVYVTGKSLDTNTSYDYATIKYNSAGSQQWLARYNGPASLQDYGNALAFDAAGNVYVTGWSEGSGTGHDFATLKYNSAGSQQWIVRYNGSSPHGDDAFVLALDATGNVHVTGRSGTSSTGDDYATIKYNPSGVQQWLARYNGPGANSLDEAAALAVDADGNVYVAGSSATSGLLPDFILAKYDRDGVRQWVANYNGPGSYWDEATAIAVDATGNVYVTGGSYGSGTSEDYATIKYNPNGVQQWLARYNGPGNSSDKAIAMVLDAAGNVYVTGTSRGSGTERDFATIKYEPNGVQQWVARYNGTGNYWDEAKAIALDAAGNVYVTGWSEGSGADPDYATIKYNRAGVEQWTARYNGPGNLADRANAIAVDVAGNVYVTGSSFGSGSYDDFATVRYSSSGTEQWVARYNGPGNFYDSAYGIGVDGAGNVYVTGHGKGVGTDDDCATIKYNSAGAEQWVARHNGPGNSWERASALKLDAVGNIYVAGISGGDGLALSYDGAGVERWVARYNGPGTTSWVYGLVVDNGGEVYVTHSSQDFLRRWSVITTIKYEQSGVFSAALKPEAPGTQFIGEEFWIDLEASGVTNLFGISFELNYTNTAFVDVVTPHASNVIPGAFLGNDLVFVQNVDEATGKVSIGVTRKAGQGGVSGSGVAARVKFKALANTPAGTRIIFTLNNIAANDPAGNPIAITALDDTTTLLNAPPVCAGPAILPVRPGSTTVSDPIAGREGDTLFVDIRVQQNATPVDAFSFTAQVNPAHLDFISAQPGNLTANFISVSAQENPPGSGTLTCGGYGLNAIPANSAGSLIRLKFVLRCNQTDSSAVVLSNPRDDLAGITACRNRALCVACSNDGDITNDRTLTPGDALCAFRIFLNNGQVPSDCNVPNFECEATAADVNCDNSVTPGDALAIFERFLAGQPPADCFARSALTKTFATRPYHLTWETRTASAANAGEAQMLKLVLRVDNPRGLSAFGLSFSYPNQKLQFLGVKRGSVTAEWTQLDAHEVEPGTITLGGFHLQPAQSTSAGDLLELLFTGAGEALHDEDFVLTNFTDDFSQATATNFAIAGHAAVPKEFQLEQNYPNPFNPETIIAYAIPAQASGGVHVTLRIYNLQGQLVRTLFNQPQKAGRYEITWNGRNERGEQVATGIFIYRLQAGSFAQSRKMVLAR